MKFTDIPVGHTFFIGDELCTKKSVLTYIKLSEEMFGEVHYDPMIDKHIHTGQKGGVLTASPAHDPEMTFLPERFSEHKVPAPAVSSTPAPKTATAKKAKVKTTTTKAKAKKPAAKVATKK